MADVDFSAIKVMVVDDDAFSRKFVTRMLEALGVGHVVTAENGVDALSQLGDSDAEVDLVICDIVMPEIDKLISHLRQKIEVDSKHPKLIITVRGVGYVFTAKVRRV